MGGEPTHTPQCHYPVTNLIAGDIWAYRLDHTCNLAAWRKRAGWLELIQVANDQCVGKIHPGRFDLNQNLTRLECRCVGVSVSVRTSVSGPPVAMLNIDFILWFPFVGSSATLIPS